MMRLIRSMAAVAAALVFAAFSTAAPAQTLFPAAGGGGSGCSTTCTYTGKQTVALAASNVGAVSLTGFNPTGSDASNGLSLTGTWNTTGASSGIYVNMTLGASYANAKYISLNNSVSNEVFYVSVGGNVGLAPGGAVLWTGRGRLRFTADGTFGFTDDSTSKAYTFTAVDDNNLQMSGGVVIPVRVVTAAGAVTVAVTDQVVVVNKTTGAATTVNLPAAPRTGQQFKIKDGKGDAATNNITITPAAGNIDGAATKVISTNYGAATVVYNGSQWNVL